MSLETVVYMFLAVFDQDWRVEGLALVCETVKQVSVDTDGWTVSTRANAEVGVVTLHVVVVGKVFALENDWRICFFVEHEYEAFVRPFKDHAHCGCWDRRYKSPKHVILISLNEHQTAMIRFHVVAALAGQIGMHSIVHLS